MSYQRSRKQKVAAKVRRAEDRELARAERERRARRARARRAALRVGVVVVALAAVAGAGLGVRGWLATSRRGPANMVSDGVTLSSSDGSTTTVTTGDPLPDDGTPTPTTDLSGEGVTQIVVYLDYSDPASAAFWSTNGSTIESWITASEGALTLEIHPVAVNARESFAPSATSSASASATPAATPTPTPGSSAGPTPTPSATANLQDAGRDYALRAANAFACVVNGAPDQALAVNDALFTAQRTFGAQGLTDAQLVDLVTKAGVTAKGTAHCITSHHYERWVQQATDRATTAVPFDGVDALGTAPLVVVGGHQYTGKVDDSNAFTNLVLQAYSEAEAKANQSSSTATPEPSSSAEPSTEPTTASS